MANICEFSMLVRGRHKDIQSFYDAMRQKGNIYMGRGADVTLEFEDNDTARIDGWCKWSVASALISNAISMRQKPNTWSFADGVNVANLQFITLDEACKKWNLTVEVYSQETGCCFQEHILVDKGSIVIDDCVDYNEYCIDEYKTKEEAETRIGVKITDEEWNSGNTYICRGGFESWDFEI